MNTYNYSQCVFVSDRNPAIIKDTSLCTECGHCLAACMEQIGVAGRLSKDLPGIDTEKNCIACGQCSASCPETAIRPKSEVEAVKAAIADPQKVVIFSTSPAVRVALGDEFYGQAGRFVEGKMVSALRALGANYVFDVTFSADLTVIEEGFELIGRILQKKGPLPQFTSCCPSWVRYVEQFHPELTDNLSTAKSPIGMQGATIKTYFAAKAGLSPLDIVTVNVTPCTAKKAETRRPELNDAGEILNVPEMRDNDFVITTKELTEWIKSEGIDFVSLPEGEFDSMLGKGSGAGVIFGNTGGVMEAALRMAYQCITGEKPPAELLEFKDVRGLCGVKEAQISISGLNIRVAVIYGTANAEEFLRGDISKYHFIEVMTCPGGCISGAGQPQLGAIPVLDDTRIRRIQSMYNDDRRSQIRNSLDNPAMERIYSEFYKAPASDLAEKLLHTEYRKL